MPDHLSQAVQPAGTWAEATDSCTLTYDDRFLRRKVLHSDGGVSILLDLPKTTSLDHGDALLLEDARLVEVIAAEEDLLRVSGDNLARLAWHIGNRHTPCQIATDHLLIQNDPVIGHMLEHLGATLDPVSAPFTPEGGAYGHGRTHSHEHGHTAHDH